MRAFLIPHASPHNSHANRISRAKSKARSRKNRARGKEQSEIIIGGQLLRAQRKRLVRLVAAPRRSGCFAATSLPQSNTGTRASLAASYYFAKCERTATACECLGAIARKIPRPVVAADSVAVDSVVVVDVVIACSRLPRKYPTFCG